MKSSLTASDFNSFYGDVMQALPDSSHDQTCDKKIVDTVADLGVCPERYGSISAFSLYSRVTTDDGPAITINYTFYSLTKLH